MERPLDRGKNTARAGLSPLVWVGFALDAVVLGLVWMFRFTSEAAYYYQDFFDIFLPVMNGALLVQGLAILLFLLRVPGAIALGWIGGVFMMPVGLLFAEGCTVTYQRRKYENLEQVEHPGRLEREFPISGMNRNPLVGGLVLAAGVAFFFLIANSNMQTSNAGWLLIILGILLVLRALRLGKAPALALYGESFAITPNWWAGTYMLPYSSVTDVAKGLMGRITLHIKDVDGQDIKMNFPRNLMPRDEREPALAALQGRLKKV